MTEDVLSDEKEAGLVYNQIDAFFDSLADAKAEKGTLWFGISGSWRKTSGDIEKGVREAVQKIIKRGDGVVSGGALSVDYFATDEALTLNPEANKIKIFLPVPFELYLAHYRRRATEGVITSEQAEMLAKQLETLRAANPNAIICNEKNTIVDSKSYYERNTEVVNASDAMVAFQVNESEGVGDALKKVLGQGKPVYLEKHVIK